MFELFAFPVDGEILSCMNDHHRGRAVICLIRQSSGSSIALHRFFFHMDHARWNESEADRSTNFLSNQVLTSSSFALHYCIHSTAAPYIIVGTTTGVKLLEIGSYQVPFRITSLQASKLLKPELCHGVVYILTPNGLQLYDIFNPRWPPEPLLPLNWSVAELSLDGRYVAFAGTYSDRSCWIQVWKTMNQNVILNVSTKGECNITSIAVSETYVCYHQTNITANTWKLVCIVNSMASRLVLWENDPSSKERSLILDGDFLVERVWNVSPYTVNLYDVPQKTTLHTYESRYPILAYLPSALSAHVDNGCIANKPIEPTPTMPIPTSDQTTDVSSTVEPNPPDMQYHPDVASISMHLVLGFSSTVAFAFICGGILAFIAIIFWVHHLRKKQNGRKYQTKENYWNNNLHEIVRNRKQVAATNKCNECYDA